MFSYLNDDHQSNKDQKEKPQHVLTENSTDRQVVKYDEYDNSLLNQNKQRFPKYNSCESLLDNMIDKTKNNDKAIEKKVSSKPNNSNNENGDTNQLKATKVDIERNTVLRKTLNQATQTQSFLKYLSPIPCASSSCISALYSTSIGVQRVTNNNRRTSKKVSKSDPKDLQKVTEIDRSQPRRNMKNYPHSLAYSYRNMPQHCGGYRGGHRARQGELSTLV